MRSVAVAAVVLLALAAHAELPVGEQLIHTKDGREVRGVITAESQTGYVVRGADGRETVVPFAEIQDVVPAGGGDALPPPVAPPPPPPPVYPEESPSPPPPAADPDAPPPEDPDAPAPVDWRAQRKGFHWSIGLGGMIDPGLTGASSSSPTVAFFVGAVPSLRWGFGWLDIAAELMPMGYFKGAVKAFFLGLNPQLRINFARIFSLGFGVYGALVLSPRVDFCLGPSFSPAIFRFGQDGQHEVRFWMAQPLIATSVGLTGQTLFMLSYSYVF